MTDREALTPARSALVPGDGLCVIVAPAGSGKSRLIADWVRERRGAGQTIVWRDLSGDEPVLSTSERSASGAGLVVDGLEPARPDHQALIAAAAGELRRGTFRVVVLSSRSSLADVRSVFSGAGHRTIGPDQLALDLAEIAGLAHEKDLRITPQVAAVVREVTGGFAGPVDIALTALSRTMSARLDPRLARPAIIERLRGALLGGARPSTRALAGSGDHWTRERVAILLPEHQPLEVLRDAEADGWLTRDDESDDYWVTTVAAGVARSAAASSDDLVRPARVEELVEFLFARELLEEAVGVALISDDSDIVTTAAIALAQRLDIEQLVALARRLARKPPDWYGANRSLYLFSTLFDRGNRRYTDWSLSSRVADRSPELAHRPMAERMLPYAMAIVHERVNGRFERSIDLSGHALNVWRSSVAAGARPDGIALLAISSACVTHVLADDGEAAERAGSDAVMIGEALGTPDSVMQGRLHLAFARAMRGDILGAKSLRTDDPVTSPIRRWLVFHPITDVLIAAEEGDLPGARAAAKRALDVGEESEHWWLIRAVDALIAALSGDRRAGERLQAVIDFELGHGRLITSRYLLAGFQVAIANLEQRHSAAISTALDRLPPHRGGAAMRAVAELARGDSEAALRLAERGIARDRSYRRRALTQLVAASAAVRLDRRESAQHHLAAAIDVMQSTGTRLPLRFLTGQARDDLVALIADSGMGGQTGEPFAQWLDAQPPLSSSPRTLERLSARELEVLSALRSTSTLQQIAADLGITHNTAKTLAARLYRKLEVDSRAAAVEAGYSAHLLD